MQAKETTDRAWDSREPGAVPSPAGEVDVAIVGYGPTGMTLAALLAQSGHSVAVLERYEGLYNLPRAACFDDEIMRTFQKLGVAEQVLPGTTVQLDYDWVNAAGETLVEITYDSLAPGGWAQLYMMYQPHVETVLDRLCKSLPGIDVTQGVTAEALEVDESGVTVRATGENTAPLEVRARFLIGADGGKSFVRQALGIGFSTYGFEENWLVCDFKCPSDLPGVPTFRQICDPAQPVAIVRIGPDHQRFSFMLEPDEDPARAVDPARVWGRVRDYITPAEAELVRVANYVFRSRITDRWRDGRVLLAGDAAHEMPPFLAQGMCSGIRDAHNLAWKLDLILKGIAGEELLDTYQPEREPHVRFITEKAIELGRVQTLRDPEKARERDERMLAARRENREPEKLVYPPLVDGVFADIGEFGGGEFFPQGKVRVGDREGLFDDLVGPGPSVVACGDLGITLTSAQRERWNELGGHLIRVVTTDSSEKWDDDAIVRVEDLDGIYLQWFEARGRIAAVVRPDWYLFGAVPVLGELGDLLGAINRALSVHSSDQPIVEA